MKSKMIYQLAIFTLVMEAPMLVTIGIKTITDALVIMGWTVVYGALMAYSAYLDRKAER